MINAIDNTINNNIVNKYNASSLSKKNTLRNFASLSYNMQNESFTSLPTVAVRRAVQETASVWHKYPLKLMVYSNDIGEAARPIVGATLAKLSLIPAVFYTGCALSAGKKKEGLGKELLFQGIASFLMPFLLVKSTRAVASKTIEAIPEKFRQNIKKETAQVGLLDKFINKFKNKKGSGYRNIALTAASIGVLALCVKPLDEAVKKVLGMKK